MTLSRREFVKQAAAIGASLAWCAGRRGHLESNGARRATSIPKESRRAIPIRTA